MCIRDRSSLAPEGEPVAFELDKENGFRWLGHYDISVDDLLSGIPKEKKSEQAENLILEYLSPVSYTHLDSNEKVLIKIPLTFENEFENLYNVDDLFIGNVSLIGIYKGKTKISGLKNSFDFFQELGNASNADSDNEVHNSQYTTPSVIKLKSEDDDEDYNYIDLLAIIQLIKSEDADVKDKPKKTARRKKAVE